MPWLLDTDVIWKIARFDLFDELLKVLNAKKADIYCLPEVHRQVKASRSYAKYGTVSIDRVKAFLNGTHEITQSDREEEIAMAAASATYQGRIERIDGGERSLFIATKHLDLSIIVTHDKKCLRTVSHDATVEAIYHRLKGRVHCFEQIVLMMIDKFGYAMIQKKIIPHCDTDEVMQVSFANGKPDHPEAACREWLENYITRLEASAPELLAK